MLVEEHDCNTVVQCLLCKTPIRVGCPPPPQAPAPTGSRPTPPPRT
jgi:hypothetical protein